MTTVVARDAAGRLHPIVAPVSELAEKAIASNTDAATVSCSEATFLRAENEELKMYALQLEAQLQVMLVREGDVEAREAELQCEHQQVLHGLMEDVSMLRKQLSLLDQRAAKHDDDDERSSLELLVKEVIEENNSLRQVLANKDQVVNELIKLPPSERTLAAVASTEVSAVHSPPQSRSENSATTESDAHIALAMLRVQLREYQQASQQLYNLVCSLHENAQQLSQDMCRAGSWSEFWATNQSHFETVGLQLPRFEAIVRLEPIPEAITERATETDAVTTACAAVSVPDGALCDDEPLASVRLEPLLAVDSGSRRTAAIRSRAPTSGESLSHTSPSQPAAVGTKPTSSSILRQLDEVRTLRMRAEKEGRELTLQLFCGGTVPPRNYYKSHVRSVSPQASIRPRRAFK